ncbi:FAD-dependent oxidoreductase [Nisaea acidiphila]|uniref:FAD-dependent oxidoreductase n=1 Tax=Nisaea acidiphila TaxID=1862145 RepID=A0A9J7AXS2_9PROT|nr:FAD-dependent oxidoreductase [Nisaea acidiphila]UUX51052.1 FAD-dependent oxidoreductase [Nisaea acidiphila]
MPEWLKRLLRPVYFLVFRLRGYPGLRVHTLPIARMVNEYDDVWTYYFLKPADLTYEAGQYVHVIAPNAYLTNHTVRHMSFASAPAEPEIAISMDLASGSRFKRRFRRARVGHTVGFHTVRGGFVRDRTTEDRPLLFIAGGIGIAPIRAHIAELGESEADWSLIYAGRDYLYRDEWGAWPGRVAFVGRASLFAAIERRIGVPDQICFVCGSAGFVTDVKDFLAASGVEPDRIRTEKFDY